MQPQFHTSVGFATTLLTIALSLIPSADEPKSLAGEDRRIDRTGASCRRVVIGWKESMPCTFVECSESELDCLQAWINHVMKPAQNGERQHVVARLTCAIVIEIRDRVELTALNASE